MSRTIPCIFLVTLLLSSLLAGAQEPQPSLRGNGLQFTQNKGQVTDINHNLRPDVLYVGETNGSRIYLRKTGFSYVMDNSTEILNEVSETLEKMGKDRPLSPQEKQKKEQELIAAHLLKVHRIDVDLAGGNPSPTIIPSDQVEGYLNYYLGHCTQGITGVKSFNKILYKSVYQGIDILFYGDKESGLKYDLIVHPGADASQIKLEYKGVDGIEIKDSRLKIQSFLGEITEEMPRVYQNIKGKIVDVKAEYVLVPSSEFLVRSAKEESTNYELKTTNYKTQTVTFKLTNYHTNELLVIDPWITYYGGSSNEISFGIAVDATGDVTITGETSPGIFPVSAGAFQSAVGSAFAPDAFIFKLNSNGNRLWATYYGGSGRDSGLDIANDANGNAILTGTTDSPNFPVSTGAFQTISGGAGDAFIVKFDPTGIRLWGSYVGGNNGDYGYGITTDALNNNIITGMTLSPNFPVTASAFQNTMVGNGDVFVMKFDANGNRIWATYYGGNFSEIAKSIAADAFNNIVITGTTFISNNFPVTSGTTKARDIFAVKFDPNGARLWAVCYGGTNQDEPDKIKIDRANNIVIAGHTYSSDYPTSTGAYQVSFGGGATDCFLLKLDPSGAMLWSTYFGGAKDELYPTCAVDNKNNIYLLSEWEDTFDVLPISCAYQKQVAGGEDQFIIKFSSAGNYLCSTYLGGPGHDDLDASSGTTGGAIACYGSFIYVSCYSLGQYPVTPGAYQTKFGGGLYDVTVAKLCGINCGDTTFTADFTANTNNVCPNTPIGFTLTNVFCDTTATTYLWNFSGSSIATSTAKDPAGIMWSAPGSYAVSAKVMTPCDTTIVTKSNYIIITPCITPTVTACTTIQTSGTRTICSGQTAIIHGTSQTAAGIYTQTFTASNSCDSISAITLNYKLRTTNSLTATFCGSYTLNNQTYSASGIYTQTLTNVSGCDSIITLNLTLNKPIRQFGNLSICQGQSVFIHGVPQSTSGVYTQTFSAVNGCDSISSVTLNYKLRTTNSSTATSCGNYTLNNQTYTTSGIYSQTLTNIAGCDSIITLNLTINFQIATSSNFQICQNQSITIHGVQQTTSGIYTQTFVGQNGCDSISSVTLILNPSPTSAFSAQPQPASIADPTVYFTDQSTGAIKWYWYFGDGDSINPGTPHPSHAYEDSGRYQVALIVENSYGCRDTSEQTIVITPDYSIYIPNTFTSTLR